MGLELTVSWLWKAGRITYQTFRFTKVLLQEMMSWWMLKTFVYWPANMIKLSSLSAHLTVPDLLLPPLVRWSKTSNTNN